MSFESDKMYNYLERKQAKHIEEQNKTIEKLKDEINLLRCEMDKCFAQSENLDKQIKDLYEHIEKLEKR